ncbi:MAG: VCBS repeat-containing protein, partial [Deltaproteobacteria bacterium]|nr:VCBS repeat-containing protein [Deltaproteobacteria bacterium]
LSYPANVHPYCLFGADLDGDLDLDLAVGNYWSGVSILFNNGDATFQSPVVYAGHNAASVFCADVDGDSDMDLAVANWFNNN